MAKTSDNEMRQPDQDMAIEGRERPYWYANKIYDLTVNMNGLREYTSRIASCALVCD